MFDYSCVRCGQSAIEGREVAYQPGVGFVCQACRKAEREPQGETVRLFEPAPAQIPEQMTL